MVIGPFAGPISTSCAACTGRHLAEALRDILPPLRSAFPGDVYVCGGRDGDGRTLSSVDRFHPSGSWEPAPPMLNSRCGAASAVLNGEIYVCGGAATPGEGDDVLLAAAERFRPGSPRWEALPDMTMPRDGAAAGVLDGHLFVCGGRTGETLELSSGERFDPASERWQGWGHVPLMSEQRVCLTSAVLGGALYVLGGRRAGQVPRSSAAAVALKGRLFVAGGWGSLLSVQSVESFSPEQGTWEAMALMQLHRARLAAVALGGSMYVFGGYGPETFPGVGRTGILLEGEKYDPEVNSWVPVPSAPTAREFHTAVRLPV